MAESSDDHGRGPMSATRRPVTIDVQVIGGPVAPMDEAYAWEQVDYLCRNSRRAMHCARLHLCGGVDDTGRSTAAVDGVVVLDDDRVICAGAVSTTMREAIDQLASRLRRRLLSSRDRERSLQPRSRAAAATVSL